MAGKDKKKKIVKASDASFFKRQLKKLHPLKEDQTTGDLKKSTRRGFELHDRTKNLRKAYKDKIMRENMKGTSGDTSEIYFPFQGEMKAQKQSQITKQKKKKTGGVAKKMNMGGVMKSRGGTFKGTF